MYSQNRVAPKPRFNVVIPFDGITTVQMNGVMADILHNFVDDVDDVDAEIYALAEALRNPSEPRTYPADWVRVDNSRPNFAVWKFRRMICVLLNDCMAKMLQNFIQETENVEVQIHALSKALADPSGCYELRQSKMRARQQEQEREEKEAAFAE